MIRNAEAGAWRRMSQFHVLTDAEIIASLSETANVIRAVSYDSKTNFAVIIVPANSPYRELMEFRRLLDLLTGLDLRPRLYKASGSDDVQLFLFFSHALKSDFVGEALSKVLSWNSFYSRAEKLFVYPTDSALALPLQRGFAWLNEDLQPIVSRLEIALDSALALFCSESTRYATKFDGVVEAANMLPSAILTDAEFWGVRPSFLEMSEEGPAILDEQPAETSAVLAEILQLPLQTAESLGEVLELPEETPAFSFACAMPEDQPVFPADSLNAFPLWLVQEDLSVEVFPIPAEQQTFEEILLDEGADVDDEQQVQIVQGQTATDEHWPRQTSQLLLVTNERPLDLQLDLFSARQKGEQPTPRSRRKRLKRTDDEPKPEA